MSRVNCAAELSITAVTSGLAAEMSDECCELPTPQLSSPVSVCIRPAAANAVVVRKWDRRQRSSAESTRPGRPSPAPSSAAVLFPFTRTLRQLAVSALLLLSALTALPVTEVDALACYETGPNVSALTFPPPPTPHPIHPAHCLLNVTSRQ